MEKICNDNIKRKENIRKFGVDRPPHVGKNLSEVDQY